MPNASKVLGMGAVKADQYAQNFYTAHHAHGHCGHALGLNARGRLPKRSVQQVWDVWTVQYVL